MNGGDRAREGQDPQHRAAGASAGGGLLVLLILVVLGSARPVTAAGARQAGPTPDRGAIRKPIVVRLADGTAVPELTVQLAPAAPELGGPPAGTAGRQGTTDATGTATFQGLGPWIWLVSLAGRFDGRALAPAAEQGRAPYGRTRAGGGFPVQVEVQEEDAPPTPVVVAGRVQPLREPATLVLLPRGADQWIPTLDLAGPEDLPRPVATAAPPLEPRTPAGVTPAAGPVAADRGDPGIWIGLGAAGLLALGAGVGVRTRRGSRAPGGDR